MRPVRMDAFISYLLLFRKATKNTLYEGLLLADSENIYIQITPAQ
jgi:hypothetical protein